MVFTRRKLNELSKEELIEKLFSFDNLSEKINDLTKKMDDFAKKFDRVFSELQISKPCNSLLRKRIIDLERSFLDNSQYLRGEMTEISPVSLEVSNDELEGLVCKVLSLLGNKVSHDDLEACHRLKKKENVIIKFKSKKLKNKIINNTKIMKNKSKDLNEVKLSNNLFISESMCAGNHSLVFKCRKLKKARNIFNTWFFNNAINVQLNQNGEIHKVFHTEDLAALLKVDDLDSFLMNLSILEFIFITP